MSRRLHTRTSSRTGWNDRKCVSKKAPMQFTQRQIDRFRRLWTVLHRLAAARGLGCIGTRTFQEHLLSCFPYLNETCTTCASKFNRDITALLDHGPEAIERAMFDYHSASKSDTPERGAASQTPPFAQHQARYRADVLSAVVSDAAVSAQLTTLGFYSLCDASHSPSAHSRIACSQSIALLLTKPLRSSPS